MSIKYFLWLFSYFTLSINSFGQNTKKSRILIIIDLPGDSIMRSQSEENKNLKVSDLFVDFAGPSAPDEIITPTVSGKRYIWAIETSKSKNIVNPIFFDLPYIGAPGDSIHIRFQDPMYRYSGTGSEKWQLQYEIAQAQKKIKDPVPRFINKNVQISLNEYLQLSRYHDEQINAVLPLIESYKNKLSLSDYILIKCRTILYFEKNRFRAFSWVPTRNYSAKDLAAMWDSTMYKPWAKWMRSQHNVPGFSAGYFYRFSREEVWKKFGFIPENNDTLASKPMRVKMYYSQLLKNYKGLRLEQTLCYLLDEQVLIEMGALNPVAKSLLKDYYARSAFPQYKKWIQSLEKERQVGESGAEAPFFTLADENGNKFTYKNIKNKFAVINFWYPGCEACKEKTPALQSLQEKFKNDTNVIFLHVSVDANKKQWLKTKGAGIYAPKGGVQLYTGDLGKKHEILSDFGITTYPSLLCITANNRILIIKQQLDLTKNIVHQLEDVIKARQSYSEDGPYVIIENGSTKAYYISSGKVTDASLTDHFTAATDQDDKKLEFSLQKNITIPPSEYAAPEKFLALSDIEGNFRAFRKLLQANLVMDDNFRWTFGKGHLVFAGDMFDRGEQVTECLWLIYSLEEKAKAAGGMVHFILGNHEIMNLNGQDRYVKEKYKNNYKLLGKTLAEVYNENSELGRWLRTKNIVEKIGDNLFCHGGISPHVNSMSITLEGINTKARPYYDQSVAARKSSDAEVQVLFNARKSPFWYRQYYDKDYFSNTNKEMIWHASEAQVDSTRKKFGVARIITGHTIVADTISVHYGGKIINTDTQHAGGKSEALLVENTLFFRVDNKGNRVLLFKEDYKQPASPTPAVTVSK